MEAVKRGGHIEKQAMLVFVSTACLLQRMSHFRAGAHSIRGERQHTSDSTRLHLTNRRSDLTRRISAIFRHLVPVVRSCKFTWEAVERFPYESVPCHSDHPREWDIVGIVWLDSTILTIYSLV